MNGATSTTGRLRIIWGWLVLLLLAPGSIPARTVNLTILHTTDLHGSIRATPDIYLEHNSGSLLQCATLIRQIREENPHTILLDGGDVFQGTAESLLTRGRIMSTAMNAMDYAAFAVGNHEFDWGVDNLNEWLLTMRATPLAANMLAGPNAPPAFRDRVRPYIILEMDGIKVAVIGLTTPNIPQWFREVNERDLRDLDSRRALESILPRVRKEQPQVMILLAHQGLMVADDVANEINGICRRFGEFDLVLGGHLHWVLAGARIGRADYAQSGSGAQGVMRIDLQYDTVKKAVVDKTFTYLPVGEHIPEDPEIRDLVAKDLERADRYLNTRIGWTKNDLSYSLAGAGLSPVQQLLCAAIAYQTGADVVLHGPLSNHRIPAGEIRMADIWRMVPYENNIGVVTLNAAEIQTIMEEAAVYLGTDRYFGTWGLQYEVHSYAPEGHRIRNLRMADGSPIHYKVRLKVALNSYHLSGGGGRFPNLAQIAAAPKSRLEIQPDSTRDMLIHYVRAKRSVDISAGTNATVVAEPPPRRARHK